MSGFFSKIFGGKKKETSAAVSARGGSAVSLVETTMQGLIEKALLDLSFEVRTETNGETEEITVELSGADQEFLTEKDGALLDAFQLFFKRVLQHQMPDARVNVGFDCNGFRDELSKGLIDLADGLKEKCLSQGRAVYLRALPPKDRKIVHQYLASDERVRSRSVGDGLYKKIKIYPVKTANGQVDRDNDREETAETV
jgi:spoIIIJ-associated protein